VYMPNPPGTFSTRSMKRSSPRKRRSIITTTMPCNFHTVAANRSPWSRPAAKRPRIHHVFQLVTSLSLCGRYRACYQPSQRVADTVHSMYHNSVLCDLYPILALTFFLSCPLEGNNIEMRQHVLLLSKSNWRFDNLGWGTNGPHELTEPSKVGVIRNRHGLCKP
jgi:hypothetical protein